MCKKIVIIAIVSLFFWGCKKPQTVQNLSLQSGSVYPSTIDQLTSIVVDGYANWRSQNLDGWGLLPSVDNVDHNLGQTSVLNLVDNPAIGPYNNFLTNTMFVVN